MNDMLSAIGELPVSSLDDPQADAEVALRLLRQENRAFQARGWHFNTEPKLQLLPDLTGIITLPAGTLRVRTSEYAQPHDVLARAGKLYDRAAGSFVFKTAAYVHITILQSFQDMPEEARTYVKLKAGRKFLARTIGSQDAVGWHKRDEDDAFASFEAEDVSASNRSIFENSDFSRVTQRRSPDAWV